MKDNNYYLGLDIGTDSVGYAVTDDTYRLLKLHGEPAWGTHVFESGNLCAERRIFRTSRRRLDRRQQRVQLIREIFASEIAKKDPRFFIRISESGLFPDDKGYRYTLFADKTYTDREYYRQYPTIHHLILDLMNSTEAHDARLVYLAVAYLVAHRGHFLTNVDKNNIDTVLDFDTVYQSFISYFHLSDNALPWNCTAKEIADILRQEIGIKAKEKAFYDLLFDGKKPNYREQDVFDRESIIVLLSGGKIKVEKLFGKEEYNEIPSVSLNMNDEAFEAVLKMLDDDAEFLIILKRMYDWSILSNIVGDYSTLSEAKAAIYDRHKKDLRFLKMLIRKYCPSKYYDVFRAVKSELANYAAYAAHVSSGEDRSKLSKQSREQFYKYINKIVKSIDPDEEDKEAYTDMMTRIELSSFMPKQVSGENRVIPYQLYRKELSLIIKNASSYLPFLNQKDSDGLTAADKILSVFEFRVPYYIGPLCDSSKFAWIRRKGEGKIYPWNFNQLVDLDKSEEAFINRMTNTCTYLPGEKVLPKNSLLYSEFMLLNEINNLKINDIPLPAEAKECVYCLFEEKQSIKRKDIEERLLSRGFMSREDIISGIDTKIKSSLTSYHKFKRILTQKILDRSEVERIIERMTYTNDRARIKLWLKNEFTQLNDDDINYISGLKFDDFGRLSKAFLTKLIGTCKETGEMFCVIDALRSTQNNLMKLLSDRFTFTEEIEKCRKEYFAANPSTLTERLDEMGVSNTVKRQIIRTMDIVNDVKKRFGAPRKIFVEMARGGKPDEKGKRKDSRRSVIKKYYENCPGNEVNKLLEELEGKEDRELLSEKLYLYFIQLGKDMYNGATINIHDLVSEKYNIDHIYPRSRIKDDSLDNKILVSSVDNGRKSDSYPIDPNIRSAMKSTWSAMHERGMISDEKYRRLTRSTPFSNEEKWNFINRQLVETRQSTKVAAALLSEMFPESTVVYVKAGLVSEFRQEYDLLKSRSVNDLHHAKDAYLNIVAGNVYNEVFSRKWFNVESDYSLKVSSLFGKTRICNGETVWNGPESIALIRNVMRKDAVHYTRYAFCKKGGFFDQNPLKAQENNALIPRKKGLDVAKYGGYNKPTASFFAFVSYQTAKEKDVILMSVDLLYAEKFINDDNFAVEYSARTISKIVGKQIDSVSFPMGRRAVKINTCFLFNDVPMCIAAKSSKGANITLSPMVSLKCGGEAELYCKRLEAFAEKQRKNTEATVSEKYDKIDISQNEQLYDLFARKLSEKPYSVFFKKFGTLLAEKRNEFLSFTVEKQVLCLLNILSIFKSGRTTGCDLSALGGKEKSAVCSVSSKVSNWKKFGSVVMLNESPSGLYRTISGNLLELL